MKFGSDRVYGPDIRISPNPDMDFIWQIRRIYGPDPVTLLLYGSGSGSGRSGPYPARLQAYHRAFKLDPTLNLKRSNIYIIY